MKDARLEVMKGTLGVLILKTLSHGSAHGYGITRWLERVTDGDFIIEEGALYPALHKLEHRGLVSAEWGISANNRRAKYYELTGEGKKELHRSEATWNRFAGAMAKVLQHIEQPA